jgi:hypothetical protein
LELSSGSEEFLQEFRALPCQNAATHFNPMIEGGVIENVHNGVHSAGFGIFCAINQCPDTGMHHGSGAHGARFDGHEKIAACQTVIAEGRPGFPQGYDFCVGCRIRVTHVAIEAAADDFTFMYYDCAYGNFSDVERSLSCAQGLSHPQFVGFRSSAVPHAYYCMRQVGPSALAQVD